MKSLWLTVRPDLVQLSSFLDILFIEWRRRDYLQVGGLASKGQGGGFEDGVSGRALYKLPHVDSRWLGQVGLGTYGARKMSLKILP